MGMDGISSSTPWVQGAGRFPSVPDASAKVTEARPDAKPIKEKPSVNAEPEPRGVPQRLGTPQQLPPNTRLHVDEETNRVVAQILDENNEVVRQIPPEALLQLSSKFSQLEGLLFDRET
jgi:hypothetical protein